MARGSEAISYPDSWEISYPAQLVLLEDSWLAGTPCAAPGAWSGWSGLSGGGGGGEDLLVWRRYFEESPHVGEEHVKPWESFLGLVTLIFVEKLVLEELEEDDCPLLLHYFPLLPQNLNPPQCEIYPD